MANKEDQTQVKMTDEALRGVYANMLQVSHTPEEFILDFVGLFPPSGIVNARVIVSPGHVQRIIDALTENLDKYKSAFAEAKSVVSQE